MLQASNKWSSVCLQFEGQPNHRNIAPNIQSSKKKTRSIHVQQISPVFSVRRVDNATMFAYKSRFRFRCPCFLKSANKSPKKTLRPLLAMHVHSHGHRNHVFEAPRWNEAPLIQVILNPKTMFRRTKHLVLEPSTGPTKLRSTPSQSPRTDRSPWPAVGRDVVLTPRGRRAAFGWPVQPRMDPPKVG